MIVVSVMYPNSKGSHFDTKYYLQKHIPLVKKKWNAMGMRKIEATKALAKADGGAPTYQVTALLTFNSMDDLQAAMAAHRDEIMSDISKFTDVEPLIQINEVISSA